MRLPYCDETAMSGVRVAACDKEWRLCQVSEKPLTQIAKNQASLREPSHSPAQESGRAKWPYVRTSVYCGGL